MIETKSNIMDSMPFCMKDENSVLCLGTAEGASFWSRTSQKGHVDGMSAISVVYILIEHDRIIGRS